MITNQTERLNFASTKNILLSRFSRCSGEIFPRFFQLETKSDERGNGLYIPSWKIFQLQIQEIILCWNSLIIL
jgi:hypothetical protein